MENRGRRVHGSKRKTASAGRWMMGVRVGGWTDSARLCQAVQCAVSDEQNRIAACPGGAAIAQVGRQVHARVEITAEIVAQNVKKGPLARCFSALGCDGLDCLLLAAVWGRLHVRARLATSTGVLLGANSSTRVWADRQDLPGTRRWRCTQHMAACRNKLVSRAAIECSAGFSHSLSFLGDSPLACLACVTSRQPSRRGIYLQLPGGQHHRQETLL